MAVGYCGAPAVAAAAVGPGPNGYCGFLLLLLLFILLACSCGREQQFFFIIILAIIAFGGFGRTFGFGVAGV